MRHLLTGGQTSFGLQPVQDVQALGMLRGKPVEFSGEDDRLLVAVGVEEDQPPVTLR